MKPMMSEETEVVAPTEEIEEESQGIDGIIETVDEYIENPELVTPETLMELKADLEDLKEYLDGETSDEPESPEGTLSSKLMQMGDEDE